MSKNILTSYISIALPTVLALTSTALQADGHNNLPKPWHIVDQASINLSVPPANNNADNPATLQQRIESLDDASKRNVFHWPTTNPNYRWMQMVLDRYAKGPPSPKKGRGIALLNVAVYDAVAVAANAKEKIKRDRPDNQLALLAIPNTYSYPSAHAAAAGAAAGVLAHLFPDEQSVFDAQAQLAANARVDAGVNFPSDVTAGLAVGKQVAEKLIAHAASDNSDSKWAGERPTGPDKLQGAVFVYPTAGDWKTWAIESTEKYIPAPPPSIDSPQMQAQLDELQSIDRNVPNSIRGWMNHSTWRAYHWWYEALGTAVFEKAQSIDMTTVARAYATVAAANHDAILACFKAKYAYWMIRPAQLDPSLPALFPNPPHPSYPAAHSCSSMSYATTIAHFFPDNADKMYAAAEEAGYSRVIAGIHYPMDKVAGETLGRGVGEEVLKFAESLVSD